MVLHQTVHALEIGAVDFVKKPSGTISLDLYNVKRSLLEKLRIAVQTNLRNFNNTTEHTYEPTVPKEQNGSWQLNNNRY